MTAMLTFPLVRVLCFFDDDVAEHGYYAEHWHSAQLLHHASAFLEEAKVATELVDDYALDACLVLGCLEHDAAIDGGKHSATVDVCHEYDVGIGMSRHRHVDEVAVPQIYLADAACTLHHYRIIALGEAVECSIDGLAKLFPTLLAEIGIGTAVADGLAVEHHLCGMLAIGLEQQRIHIGATRHPRCLCLHCLGSAYLISVWGGVGVERHVLRFERCGVKSVLHEYATEGSSYYALAHIAASSCQHHRS